MAIVWATASASSSHARAANNASQTCLRSWTCISPLAQELAANPDRQVWHRAASVVGQDDAIADDLEASGWRSRRRGGHAVAEAGLERSAELTSDAGRRASRLLSAVEVALELGTRSRRGSAVGERRPRLSF
jgi:hypothetical protein